MRRLLGWAADDGGYEAFRDLDGQEELKAAWVGVRAAGEGGQAV